MMKKIRDISEDEMISVFLKAEINSSRWSASIIKLLEKAGKSRALIDTPDINVGDENAYRKKLLGEFRGYEQNALLFETFPKSVKWELVNLNKEELEKVKYMKYNYWDKLSNKTRLVKDGAKSVKNGIEIYKVSNDGFLKAAKAIENGVIFPYMIFVTKDMQSDIVVLEGHQRITAHFLVPKSIENGLDVILGLSDDIAKWDSY